MATGTPVEGDALFCKNCGLDVTQGGPSQDATIAMPADSTMSADAVTTEVPRVHATMRQTLRDATLGEYEILSELGRGGMATVFLAEDRRGRSVAVKAVHRDGTDAPGGIERALAEARAGQAVRHPNVVRVLDCGIAERPPIDLARP